MAAIWCNSCKVVTYHRLIWSNDENKPAWRCETCRTILRLDQDVRVSKKKKRADDDKAPRGILPDAHYFGGPDERLETVLMAMAAVSVMAFGLMLIEVM